MLSFLFQLIGLTDTGDTSWMTEAKYGIFMHYQYRILLNYSIKTDPILPEMLWSFWEQCHKLGGNPCAI
jgi:hypothetical protein